MEEQCRRANMLLARLASSSRQGDNIKNGEFHLFEFFSTRLGLNFFQVAFTRAENKNKKGAFRLMLGPSCKN